MVQNVRRTIEIPQLHVNKVVDFPVLFVVRVPQVVSILVVTQRLVPKVLLTMEIPQLQFIDKVIDVPMCCLGDAWCSIGPCAQAQGQGLTPAIRAGKGWRGRRELPPRCSATRIRCMPGRSYRQRHVRYSRVRTTTTTTTASRLLLKGAPVFACAQEGH